MLYNERPFLFGTFLPALRPAVFLMLLVRLILSASLLATTAASSAMTFDEARALFHERSDLLRADAAEVERAKAAAEGAKSLSGPQVDITVMHLEGKKDLEIDTPSSLRALGGALGQATGGRLNLSVPSTLGTELDLGGPRAVLQATLPIYTGGRISAQQNVMQHKVRESEAARSERLETKDAELAQRYWGVQLARSVAALRQARVADEVDAVRRARRFEAKGLVSGLERMSVEVSRDAARREAAAAETDRQVAEAEFMSQLREAKVPELTTPLFVLKGDLGTLSDWQKKAKLNAPLLWKADAQIRQAREGVRAAEGAFHPQVFAFGTKNLIKHYLSPVEPDWMAGIGVKFTLWDRQDRLSEVSAAKLQVQRAEAGRAEADHQLMTAVEVAFLRTTQAREQYDLTASTVALAAENLRLREKSFGEGLSTALDVSEARTQLVGAEIAQRAAAYQFVVAWVMLHAASGSMQTFSETLTRPDLVAVQ